MAEDERLREALLELQLLREREAQSLDETRNLLECVEAYSSAATPGEALHSIFLSVRNKIGADASLLGRLASENKIYVAASDNQSWLGQAVVSPYDLGARPRNLVDLSLLGEWTGGVELSNYSVCLSVPVLSDGETYALVLFKESRPPFGKGSVQLVERLAGLALRALQGTKIASENKLLAAAIHGSSSGFAIADARNEERPLIYVNEAFEKISGYPAEEVLGINCRFLSAEDPSSEERSRLREAVKENAPGQFLLRNRRKDGTLFWNELTLFPVENDAGDTVSLVATQNDVSQRVEAAAERDRMRAQMARALTATEDAFLVLEKGFVVAFANEAAREIFFAPDVDWAVGSTFAENWEAYLEASRDMPGRITSLLQTPDLTGLSQMPNGREIDLPDGRTVLVRASDMSEGSVVLYANDVTPIKSAQRLLSQRLAAIEAAKDGIAITDGDGRLTYLNSAASEMLGFKASALALGKYWQSQYEATESLQGLTEFASTLTRTVDKRLRTHEVTGTALESGGNVIIFRDITHRVDFKTREADLKAGLQQLQRQEATAQLTAGIAHDFNNLLSAINGSATLIGMEEALTDGLKAHLNRISTAGAQAARLVNRLLDIGSNPANEGTFGLNSVLADIPSLVGPSLPATVDFAVRESAGEYLLKGDPSALSQVIVNLVLNARDAIAHKTGAITLRIEPVSKRSSESISVGELLSAEQYVKILVSDTGPGIPAAERKTVFEPYFSTKGRKGTGLGLAMVAMQVHGIGGAVGLTSNQGLGTTISVYWPLAASGGGNQTNFANQDYDLSGQTIIVLDDDTDVASVAAKYLEAQGAEVAICMDPRDAIEAVQDAPDAWSAIITDYDMPVMNGGDVAEKTKKANPFLPVILVTALTRRLSDPRIDNGTIDNVLAKPVDFNHLASLLHEYHQARKQG
ncbi:MAG: PAS domain-containing protein [Pseudomonadota bacterium]